VQRSDERAGSDHDHNNPLKYFFLHSITNFFRAGSKSRKYLWPLIYSWPVAVVQCKATPDPKRTYLD
jgi:hypothetical protein